MARGRRTTRTSRSSLVKAARGVFIAVGLLWAVELVLVLAGVEADEPFFVERTDILGRQWMVSNPRVGDNWYADLGWGDEIGIPRSERFAAEKPAGTYRVFVIGGSAAYGSLLEDNASWASEFEAVLDAASARGDVEVINCALRGAALSVFPSVVQEITAYEPDLLVIYSGHNEYYGAHELSWWRRRRLVRLMSSLVRSDGSSVPSPAGPPAQVGMPADDQFGPGDPTHDRVVRRYARDLDRVIRGIGDVPVLAYTVHGSERHVSPLCSHVDVRCGIDDHREGLILDFEAAPYLLDESVRDEVESLLQACPDHAGLTHLAGLARFATGDVAGAREALADAIELDCRPVRAREALRDEVRALAGRYDGRVHVCDVEGALRERAADGILGRELFLDHVHYSIFGGYVLALEGARVLAADPATGLASVGGRWLTYDELRQRQGLGTADNILALMRTASFFDRSCSVAAVASRPWVTQLVRTERDELMAQLDPEERVVMDLLNPARHQLHVELAQAYEEAGQVDQALAHARTAVIAVPGSAPAELLLARMLHERGDDDGARDHLALALLADEAIGGGAELAAELALPLAP